jgi:hypothetical protein
MIISLDELTKAVVTPQGRLPNRPDGQVHHLVYIAAALP